MAIKVRIAPIEYGEDSWGYRVSRPSSISVGGRGIQNTIVYEARARVIDRHFLLEERNGDKSSDVYSQFGIKRTEASADKELLKRARTKAKETLESLMPQLEDVSGKEI